MAISYNPVEFTGQVFEEVFMEALYQNDTIGQNKVRLLTDIKAQTTITEMDVDVTLQPYTCGIPESDGNIRINDGLLTPCKYMSYQEWCPDDLRFSRFSTGMRAGAWEIVNDEWVRIVLETYATKMSRESEVNFWSGVSSATQTAVAGLTPGSLQTQVSTEEQSLVAAMPTALCDGIVSYLIYNNGGVGKRIKVVGTTIDASNIGTEYSTLYASIPAVLLNSANFGELRIFAPESHAQLIRVFNLSQTYRDTFFIDNAGNYFFLGIKIEFVPLPENTMIAGRRTDLIWGTDLTADYGMIKIDVVANNADTRFFKGVFTQGATAVSQAQKVLYVG